MSTIVKEAIRKLSIECPYKILKIEDVKLTNKPNEHGYLYVKCLNAFRKSPGGITLIGEDPTVQRELNGILLGISSRYYDDLDKDSREIMEETGNIEEEDMIVKHS